MVIYLVCFDLSATPQEQRDQIFFWLQFLHSSIPNLPQLHTTSTNNNNNNNNNNDNKNWRVMLVGLKSDLKGRSVFTTDSINSWQSQMPDLPLFHHQLFEVSSLDKQQGVSELLNSISLVCSQIFEKHSVLIPSSFRKLLHSIKNLNSSSSSSSSSSDLPYNSSLPLLHPPPSQSQITTPTNTFLLPSNQLHQLLQGECDMDLSSFNYALRYLHAIGHIVFLQNGMVCTVPTMIPKLLAKFISPTDIQNHLLSDSSDVQILTEQQIGFVLQVNPSNNRMYVL